METNENKKNTITAKQAENAQIKVNTQPSAEKAEQINTKPVIAKEKQNAENIDEQATQRIEFLSELIKDTEIAQKENLAAKINEDKNIKSNNDVQENKAHPIKAEQTNEKAQESAENKEKNHTQDKKDY